MRYRPLGRSGLMVSVVGLGANNFGMRLDLDRTRSVVHAAIDAGVNFIDTSDSYGGQGGSEQLLGQVLERRREQVVLATKFGSDMGGTNGPDWGARASRRYIVTAVEASLRRLRTDWIDLYQLHRPDGITPLEETLSALDQLVRQGKVRCLGSSNLAPWQVADASWIAATKGLARFESAQNHYSLLNRQIELELVPACLEHGVSIIPYFPLANGLLTGKWRRGEEPPAGSRLADGWARGMATEGGFETVEKLRVFADETGHSMVEVAIAGLAAQPAVASVIAGATSAEQIQANAAAGEWELSSDELATMNAIAPSWH